MSPSFFFNSGDKVYLQFVLEEGDRALGRGWHLAPDGRREAVLAAWISASRADPASAARLTHEYKLRDELVGVWAATPLKLLREQGHTVLLLRDPGGEPLTALLGAAMETDRFLDRAIGIASALSQIHQRGLIHRDLKPAHIFTDASAGTTAITGFGVASRISRGVEAHSQVSAVTGNLAYMAPEQTGRMNRPVDARSDLYALGVMFYEMLTGVLPFSAGDTADWVHSHLARQPVSPVERLPTIPVALSDVVLKLLAKTPDERYQSAAGLEADLRRCRASQSADGGIETFALGQQDFAHRLMAPTRLYGRESEIAALLAAFERVEQQGKPELVLISGYAGVGKTAVVTEFQRQIGMQRVRFASGKVDQYRSEIPYSTLALALQTLIRPLLARSETELAPWRAVLDDALGPNASLLATLIPEIGLILGQQPVVNDLPLQDARHRFQLAFRSLIGAFAHAESPLVLFLDDVQWLDAATLDLIEHLATDPELKHVLFVCAYRDNEIAAGHPLPRCLASIRRAGTRVSAIALEGLRSDQMSQIVADVLRCDLQSSAALTELMQQKTAGNPFFAIHFLNTLLDEDMLVFDHRTARWSWDLDQIRAKGFTDNVVDLMLTRLGRLPEQTQDVLKLMACVGNEVPVDVLVIARHGTLADLDEALRPAVTAGLVLRKDASYRFLHDRVHEAAYALIAPWARAEAHLAIGRRLVTELSPDHARELVFDIVGQLNRGAALITEVGERERLAELNLLAGSRAMASAAYLAALTHFTTGSALLRENAWETRPELVFMLELRRAESEFLTGASDAAEGRLHALSQRAIGLPDLAAVTQLRLELLMALGRRERAVEVGLEYLRRAGVAWDSQPSAGEVQREYDGIWSRLGERPIESLLDLPKMTDPVAAGTMAVLTALMPPAWYTDASLRALVIGRMVNLSLEYGNGEASCLGYAWLSMILVPQREHSQAGFRFGRLGFQLADRDGEDRIRARVYQVFGGHVMQWTEPIRNARDILQRAIDVTEKLADRTFACFIRNNLLTHSLASGEPLREVQREAEASVEFARQTAFGLGVDRMIPQLQLVRTLAGLTPTFGVFDDASFNEAEFESRVGSNPSLSFAFCWYWIRKLQARYFAGDAISARDAAERAEALLWTSPSFYEQAEYQFYAALARAAFCHAELQQPGSDNLRILAAHHQQLSLWAEHCKPNFGSQAALVGAEIARLEQRSADAMQLYEEAIGLARDHDLIHHQALANELAALFYAERGFEKIARVYMQDARQGYLCWGALGKVQQLEARYPYLRETERIGTAGGTIGAPVEHLDLATVIAVSQAVSKEVILENLLNTLMRTAIEQAGAQRGLLLLIRDGEPRVAAEATTAGDAVIVSLRDGPIEPDTIPVAILNYVVRTNENIILDDASVEGLFVGDPYIRRHRARSVLCLPLLTQAKLIGVLYLENNLAARLFVPARTAVLKLLASQAAIAVENTRLYRDLGQREARIHRLVEANIIGIWIWHLDGRILEANDLFLRMVGYERDDLLSQRLRWTDLTAPGWLNGDTRIAEAFKLNGTVPPFETEFLHRDGSHVPVLLGSANFDESGEQGVSFVLDLTERKRAQEDLQQVQADLAHVTRVTTLNALTASIAHDVNQPLASIITDAKAALRWLARTPPDLGELKETVERIVEGGHRASAVIAGVRALLKKSSPDATLVDLNDLIEQSLVLLQGEIVRHHVQLRIELEPSMPLVTGDRVQLQQVLINLLMNGIEAMKDMMYTPRQLWIRSRTDSAGSVLIAVRDSGPGLSPEISERVFEPFYTSKAEGLGMGLAICRLIIGAHRGRLWASTDQRGGALFQFSLPAEICHPVTAGA
ncbi:trifunctional serine/threonine-protein kinase/ATP-binding protein/sensor histidine kinase [Paraburkholderia atlantica]|uniref:trifunctional serine/threonine-protein kinase/ATP-binding protein/sensor histidine kinase n=1 Tax=Paraburkholderia atlantica TaxID=2654982 RepID=UPI003D1C948B